MQQLFLYIFSAPTSWGTRTAQAGSPFPGGSFFSAPAERGTRTALACSPLTGGKFFAEPQRGDSPSADGGSVAAPAAGAKRKDNLRFSFLFELLPFPCFLIWRRLPICDRCEKEYGRGFFLCCGRTTFGVRPLEQPIRRVRYRSATHVVYSTQTQHDCVAQSVSLEFTHGTCECRRSVAFIFAGAVYHNALTNCAALSCRALRRVARLCSRMVSDTVNTRIHGRPTAVLRKKKSSAVPS